MKKKKVLRIQGYDKPFNVIIPLITSLGVSKER
jgi:hypothetical protein